MLYFKGLLLHSNIVVFLSYENYSVFYPDEELVYINADPGTIVHIKIYVLKKYMNKSLFIGLKMNGWI